MPAVLNTRTAWLTLVATSSPLLLLLLQMPLPVREAVYDIVAANRYSWFGRSKVCQVRRGCCCCCCRQHATSNTPKHLVGAPAARASVTDRDTVMLAGLLWCCSMYVLRSSQCCCCCCFCFCCCCCQVPDTSVLERFLDAEDLVLGRCRDQAMADDAWKEERERHWKRWGK
jgi:hypothetical protein